MPEIQILYTENIISRKKSNVTQRLTFFLRVSNLAYDKSVIIHWSGENQQWQNLNAQFHCTCDANFEYWLGATEIALTEQQALAGNIEFSAVLHCGHKNYWDNNGGSNYFSEADSGIKLLQRQAIQNVAIESRLARNQSSATMKVAVQHVKPVDKVFIRWSTDNWVSSTETECQFKINFWDKKEKSNARNGNQYGVQIWQGKIKTDDAFRLQYVVYCVKDGQTYWDNNFGKNYTLEHDPLRILILNLHCYQESNQDYKFSQIAHAIAHEDVDIVCFQEVAENWNDGHGDWNSNSANIINQRLPEPFFIYTDWSHLGFDRYREGVGILSRFPIQHRESRYVSDDDDCYSIHSRKVVMAEINVPIFGKLNVFSAHLSWWEDGFRQQFENLSHWAGELMQPDTRATLLCGDFNVMAGSEGYALVVDGNQYHDQFLAANNKGLFDQVYRVNDAHWQHLLSEDYRIDYIFLNKEDNLTVIDTKVLFTEHDYGRVSDHCGYMMAFEPDHNNVALHDGLPE